MAFEDKEKVSQTLIQLTTVCFVIAILNNVMMGLTIILLPCACVGCACSGGIAYLGIHGAKDSNKQYVLIYTVISALCCLWNAYVLVAGGSTLSKLLAGINCALNAACVFFGYKLWSMMPDVSAREYLVLPGSPSFPPLSKDLPQPVLVV